MTETLLLTSADSLKAALFQGFLVLFFLVIIALLLASIREHYAYKNNALPMLSEEELGGSTAYSLPEEAPEEQSAFAFAMDDEDTSTGDEQADELLRAARATQPVEEKSEGKKSSRRLFGRKA